MAAETSSSSGGSTIGSTDDEVGCGDGTVVAPEECDDGNLNDGDGCNSDCQLSGSVVWCKAEIGDDEGAGNLGRAVAVDSQGNAIVVGGANNGETGVMQAVVVKYAGDGTLLWTQALPGEPWTMGVVVRSDDSIVVSTEAQLVRMSSAGEITASSPVLEEFSFDDNGLAISSAGVIAFAANLTGPEQRGAIGVLNDDLTVRWWQKAEDQAANTAARAIVADPDGNWLLGGTVVVETIDNGDTGLHEITAGILRKYDPEGSVRWSRTLPSPDEQYGYALTAVRLGADDETVVLGHLENAGLSAPNMVLTAIAADGKIVEQTIVANHENSVFGYDLVVTNGGERIIAGRKLMADASPSPGFVERYSASGELRWSFLNRLVPTRASSFGALRADGTGDLLAVGSQVLEDAPHSRMLVCKIRR